ncbi:hypothetical protein BKA70DRAFT_1418484 [Coprinopsis sp. MPI-PUGE-AT-0042]|nr:hypothetical protein BKA70DRAFT_1242228 [Coprinopsis sp. MPI-PUGE-AT-0042]KAH6874142.1 hypothetical protein BKA70DRAFT_1449664 [Coprinopsis sp. MPI-PUGE-AT-0042]KAH6876772.1 hypothetical protein BKA70DRAFT_1448537 [Coprinopsis sp. MPI-PUGE-AT-0042]KAH6879645.1 hypothetical protein BKA70DRAFT_1239239 [Coprinopsis sp. MPI-PUGE-AT-0042]KAH6915551.1 hypothetical protein BKA70DRAFT_1418484 [Coprinopsis sp. MPI-PUGE-AT-0042]
MVRNIFIDESARDVEDDWEEEQDEEDNDGEELNERVSVNQTSTSEANSTTEDDLSATNRARWISVVDVIASAYAAEPATHSIGSSCVADGGTPHDQANIASGEITRPFATSIASKSAPSSHGPSFGRPGSSEASSSSLRTIELVQSKAPALSMPRPFVPLPHQYLYSGWLGPQRQDNGMQTLNASALLLSSRSLEWTRIQSGTYRNDIGLIVDVAENVATTYVVPRIGDPDAPRRRGSKRFFTSKEVRRYVRSGRDFTYENSLGFDRWTLGRGHTRIFKCGFEVLSLKTGYSGPGELPTVEEFQLFYTNHCPHLDTQEGLELLERTARLLLPPISPRERCEIVGGPLFGSVCTVTGPSHNEHELDVVVLGGPHASVPACLLRRFFRPGDLVEARLGFHVGTVAFVVDVQDATVTALDVESCSEVTFLKDFLVFHNEAFTPMGDDAHRWLSVGHINRAPNGVQIGDMCEVIRGPEAGAKGRLIDKIGRPSSVAYDSYRMTYGLELDVADKGTRALVEVDGQYRLIIAPTKDLKLLTEYMPLTGADVSRLVGSHPHLSTIIPVQTMLDDLPDRFTRFIGYRVTVIGTHHLKGSQGWLRAVSMDVAVCELDHSAVFSKATHQLHVDKIGVYCSTSRKWVKLEDAIRPNRRGITMVYEKEGAPQRPLMRARTPPAPPLPSQYLGSVWDPDPQKTNGCELSKWIEWFPALASALPTPGLLVKLEAPFIMFHGNPNVWRIMKLNGSAAPSLVYGVEGVFSFPIEHPTEVPPDRMLPLRPSEVQRPYEALVVHRRHEFFGRVVLVKPCDSPRVWVVSLPTGKDKRKFRLEDEDLVLYGRL